MSLPVAPCGSALNVTATGNVTQGSCQMLGFFVNSTSSGTLVFRAGGSAGRVLNGAITPAAGAFYWFPAVIDGALHLTVGGTIDITVFVAA